MVRIATLDDDGLLTPGQVPALATLGATATGEALVEAVDAAAARTALGLGTAATTAATAYATAAQGALADTAVQPGDLDTAVTALDANAASALRVQQDARLSSTFVTVVDAGTDLDTARPTGAAIVYWQFDAGVDVGTDGANVTNGVAGDLYYVAGA